MSSRNSRRHRKRIDDDIDYRPHSHRREEPVKIKHVEPRTEPQIEENGNRNSALRNSTNDVIIIDDLEETSTAKETPAPPKDTDETNGNGVHDEAAVETEPLTLANDGPDAELEPLVVDSEDPELQFDDNSDVDSHKSSPVVTSRCATRRSQTRNIPTPRTPKSMNELNGDEKENTEEVKEQTGADKVVVEEMPVIKETECEEDVTLIENGNTAVVDEENQVVEQMLVENEIPTPEEPLEEKNDVKDEAAIKITEKDLNVSMDSCDSALSTQVNVGGDVTRDLELTLPDESSFLNTAKDLSVVETLRRMSSRRAIRAGSTAKDYRKTLLMSQAEKQEFIHQQRSPIEKVTGLKRKTRSKTPENPKRFKSDTSPGFFSYFSSPLSMIRNRFNSGDSMSASTPKLTSYKAKEVIADPELSKIEDSTVPIDKRRCVIM